MIRVWVIGPKQEFAPGFWQIFGAPFVMLKRRPVMQWETVQDGSEALMLIIEPGDPISGICHSTTRVCADTILVYAIPIDEEEAGEAVQVNAETTPENPVQKARPEKKNGQQARKRTGRKNGQKPGQAVRVFLLSDADNWNLSVRDIARELNVSKSVVSSVRAQLLSEKGQVQ